MSFKSLRKPAIYALFVAWACFITWNVVLTDEMRGTVTKGLASKSDLSHWTGTAATKTFSRPTSTGASITLPQFDWVGVDVCQIYGSGTTRTDVEIDAALTAIGTADKAELFLSPGTWVIGSSHDWSAYSNVTWHIPRGAIIQTGGNIITLFPGSHITNNDWQMFDAAPGEVLLRGVVELRPEWWGAVSTTDVTTTTYKTINRLAIQSAYDSIVAGATGVFALSAKIKFRAGQYMIDDYIDLDSANFAGGHITVTFEGDAWRNTYIRIDNDTAQYVFYDPNTAVPPSEGRTYHFKNFQIGNTFEDTPGEFQEGVSWHPATVFHLRSAARSTFEDIYIYRFTEGFNLERITPDNISDISHSLRFTRVVANSCKRGVTGDELNNTIFDTCAFTNNGFTATPREGWAVNLWKSHGVTFLNCNIESMNSSYGLMLEACQGVNIYGGDWETNPRTILAYGDQEGGSYAAIKNWTTGIVISGVSFWDSWGIQIEDGVKGVNMTGCSFKSRYPEAGASDTPSSLAAISLSGVSSPKYVADITFDSSNVWPLGVEPVAWFMTGQNHAVKMDGRSGVSTTAVPSTAYATWKRGTIIVARDNPGFTWIVQESGTLGTLNSGATTATGLIGEDTIVVSDLTDLVPGVWLNLTLDDASVQTVVLGSCDEDTLTCAVFPVLTAAMTAGAVAYNPPVFKSGTEDITKQTVSYSATIAPDLSLGNRVYVGTLTGNIKIDNPTNAIVGSKFLVRLAADGSDRSITYGTWYAAGGVATIAANTTMVLEFYVGTSTGIVPIKPPTVTPFTNLTDFDTQTAWRVFYSDGSGDTTELALGADGTYLRSNGAAAAPTFDTPASLAAASVNDVNTGTSTTTAVTPDALAGSNIGRKPVTLKIAANDALLVTGDSQDCFSVPSLMNGWSLKAAGCHVYTVSSSGLPSFQIHKKLLADDSSVDLLSVNCTIDESERDSSTATTALTIAASPTVATGDEVCIDVDTAGTGTKGGEVHMIWGED